MSDMMNAHHATGPSAPHVPTSPESSPGRQDQDPGCGLATKERRTHQPKKCNHTGEPTPSDGQPPDQLVPSSNRSTSEEGSASPLVAIQAPAMAPELSVGSGLATKRKRSYSESFAYYDEMYYCERRCSSEPPERPPPHQEEPSGSEPSAADEVDTLVRIAFLDGTLVNPLDRWNVPDRCFPREKQDDEIWPDPSFDRFIWRTGGSGYGAYSHGVTTCDVQTLCELFAALDLKPGGVDWPAESREDHRRKKPRTEILEKDIDDRAPFPDENEEDQDPQDEHTGPSSTNQNSRAANTNILSSSDQKRIGGRAYRNPRTRIRKGGRNKCKANAGRLSTITPPNSTKLFADIDIFSVVPNMDYFSYGPEDIIAPRPLSPPPGFGTFNPETADVDLQDALHQMGLEWSVGYQMMLTFIDTLAEEWPNQEPVPEPTDPLVGYSDASEFSDLWTQDYYHIPATTVPSPEEVKANKEAQDKETMDLLMSRDDILVACVLDDPTFVRQLDDFSITILAEQFRPHAAALLNLEPRVVVAEEPPAFLTESDVNWALGSESQSEVDLYINYDIAEQHPISALLAESDVNWALGSESQSEVDLYINYDLAEQYPISIYENTHTDLAESSTYAPAAEQLHLPSLVRMDTECTEVVQPAGENYLTMLLDWVASLPKSLVSRIGGDPTQIGSIGNSNSLESFPSLTSPVYWGSTSAPFPLSLVDLCIPDHKF